MARFPLVIFVLVLILAGCARHSAERPIEDSVLVEILADLHVEEARINHDLPGVVSRDSVLARHGTTDAELNRTLGSYAEDLPGYLRLYDRVINELSERYARERDTESDSLVVSMRPSS